MEDWRRGRREQLFRPLRLKEWNIGLHQKMRGLKMRQIERMWIQPLACQCLLREENWHWWKKHDHFVRRKNRMEEWKM